MERPGNTATEYSPEFIEAVNRVIEHEGGYTHDRRDAGGETKFGISKRQYPDMNIALLTRDDAIAIYFRDWWERYGYAALPRTIGAKLLDLAVNIGNQPAVRCLQRAVRACGTELEEDGKLGRATYQAAGAASEPVLLAALRAEAAGHYRLIASVEERAGNPSGKTFLAGWLRRAYG